jgi:hypothetical protein
MNSYTQPGGHPEAESLNAFAEQVLSSAEHGEILAHLALCSRCREVVFLAQEAAGAEAGTQTVAKVPGARRPQRVWFAGWRLAWVPGAALAGLVGFVVLHHFQSVPTATEQLARNAPQGQVANSLASNGEEAAAKTSSTGLIDTKTGGPSARATEKTNRDLSSLRRSLPESTNQLAAIRERDVSAQEIAPVEVNPTAPEAKSSSAGRNLAQKPAIGGPYAANQALQQQQEPARQQEVEKDQFHSAQYPANAPGVAAGAASLGIQGMEAQSRKAPAAPAAAPARTFGFTPAKSDVAATDEVALNSKKNAVTLPGGKSALSVATAQGRTVAIDPSGLVFLTEGPGEKWIPIAVQWTGRAVLVRSSQPLQQGGPAAKPAIFELVTDRTETWVSLDGKSWIPKALPQK